MRPPWTRWLASLTLAVLGAGAALLAQAPRADSQPPPARPQGGGATANAKAPPGKTLRLSRNVPGDAKPVVIEADNVATWTEDGRVALRLEGRVLIQQGVVQCRFQRGAAWADLDEQKKTGVLQVTFYGEGQTRIDTSSEVQDGEFLIAELHTRGELKLRASRGKVIGQDRSADPLVTRARQAGVGQRRVITPVAPPPLPPLPGVQPASASGPQASTAVQPAIHTEKSERPAPAVTPVKANEDASLPPVPGATAPRTTLPPAPVSGEPEVPATPGKSVSRQPPSGGPPDPPPPSPRPAPAPAPAPSAPAPVPGPPPLPMPAPAPPQQGQPPVLGQPSRVRSLEYRMGPRTGTERWNIESTRLDDGRWLITISNGVVLSVRGLADIDTLEVEADRAVIWTRPGKDARPSAGPDLPNEPVSDLEFYMAGHVSLRTTRPRSGDKVVIDADELYYDTSRSVAIALQTRLQIQTGRAVTQGPTAPAVVPGQNAIVAPASQRINTSEPIVVTAQQLYQTGQHTYEVIRSDIFSSKLPSDPGLKLTVARATLEERRVERRTIFGQPVVDRRTGEQLYATQSLLRAENVVGSVENVPFLYLPYLATNARDPFGPLENVRVGGNSVFGFETGITLNMYKMLGMLPYEGTRWKLYPDYMAKRGPSLGTLFSYQGRLAEVSPEDAFFFPEKAQAGDYIGDIRAFAIYDHGFDNLGPRPPNMLTFEPTGTRGRATWNTAIRDYPGGFSLVAGASFLSDRNYLEQYFKREFDQDPNQATFVYGKHQGDFWAYSALAQGRINPWITTTEWLPRLDGYLQGVSLFDGLISNTRVGAGLARLSPSNDPANPVAGGGTLGGPAPTGLLAGTLVPPFYQTLQQTSLGRAHIFQELLYPVDAGPVRLAPYLVGDAAAYSNDLTGEAQGRLWGGAGLRASMPLSRLYPSVQSEMFNLDGLNHKVTLGANFLSAYSNSRFTTLPQLDLLDDDATAQQRRELTPWQPLYNQRAGLALATSPLYDPQRFAIRRLVDNRIDTLDQVEALQLEVRQRLQTRRGHPGFEHIVDWMTLDLSGTYFPRADRDNFGEALSFLEYRYLWNVGDRTSFESTGWYDPFHDGARVTTFGLYLDRPDRTSFFVGYRQIDPLQSKMVTGAVTYIFSPKYAMTVAVAYDMGISQAINNSVVFTRTGRDLSISAGFSYNSLQNNFGLIFEIIPNLMGQGRGYGGGGLMGAGGFLGR
jgi:hypothetical protein